MELLKFQIRGKTYLITALERALPSNPVIPYPGP
jgi:hypothetical protein